MNAHRMSRKAVRSNKNLMVIKAINDASVTRVLDDKTKFRLEKFLRSHRKSINYVSDDFAFILCRVKTKAFKGFRIQVRDLQTANYEALRTATAANMRLKNLDAKRS